MQERFARIGLLLGEAGMEKLAGSRVAVFGIGGVGSYVTEALARSGIGHFILVDNDTVSITNINRQLHANSHTVGKAKTELMAQRIMDINPLAEVQVLNSFYSAENREVFTLGHIDYLVDAIDSVASKIDLIQQAQERNIPIISSMGTGNKLNPAELEVADIYKTTVCPLAIVMRQRLKKAGIKKLKVVYSKEKPLEHQPIPEEFREDAAGDRPTVGSVAFVPSVAGLIIASEVVKDLCAFAV